VIKFSLIIFALLVLAVGCAAPTQNPTFTPTTPTDIPATATPGSTPTIRPSATPTPMPTTQPSATPTSLPSPTPAGAWISLMPRSGGPGTTVQIRGHIPGGPSADQAKGDIGLQSGTVCWAGCETGLLEELTSVQWSSTMPGDFTLQFTVPAVPWLGARGPQALVPGMYTVGIQCVAPRAPGCALDGAQATATFDLTGKTPTECTQGPCSRLVLNPPSGPPGTLVQVGGWGPLTEIISTPFGYSLVLESAVATALPEIGSVQQDLSGNLSGSFRAPLAVVDLGILQSGTYTLALEAIRINASAPVTPTLPQVTVVPLPAGSGERILLAPTTFTLTAAPDWGSLGEVRPSLMQQSLHLYSAPLIAVDRTDPQRLAYCAPGTIQLSTDGGASWSSISTTEVVTLAAATSYPLFNSAAPSMPACDAVTFDPGHSGSFYAVFTTAKKPYGAPPTFFAGFFTTDAGKSWQAVPVPANHTVEQFGGFRETEQGVQVPFRGQASVPNEPVPSSVEQTTDGGHTWSPAELSCPDTGPCITWGPAPSEIGSMGPSYPQQIEVSTDGGVQWTNPSWPRDVILNGGPSELASLSATKVALLSGPNDYPFRLSEDGGKTWHVIALPALPGSGNGYLPLYAGLQMLPSGALLAQSQDQGAWHMLPPTAGAWCPVDSALLPSGPDLMAAAGDRLWWLERPGGSGTLPAPRSVLLGDLRCTTTQ
jgi:hypothetical protein